MKQHIPEEFSTRLIEESHRDHGQQQGTARDPDEDEEDEEEDNNADEPPVVREPDED